MKSVIIEHPKTSSKLSKTIRQAEIFFKVRSNSSLYSDTKRSEIFLNQKIVKIIKWVHAFKGYGSSHNVEILNFFFDSEVQLKGAQSAIKKNQKITDWIKRI